MRIHEFLQYQASKRPNGVALEDWNGDKWTFEREWNCTKAAADLLKLTGVQRGDRVLLVTENCAAVCAFIYACSLVGAWAVPVNARHGDRIEPHRYARHAAHGHFHVERV